MATKQISRYDFNNDEVVVTESYDSNIPVDLATAFDNLKEDLHIKSEGVYSCSPIIYDKEIPGVAVGIFERRDGVVRKSNYVLTIRNRADELREKIFSIRQVFVEKYDINKDELHNFLIKRGYYKR